MPSLKNNTFAYKKIRMENIALENLKTRRSIRKYQSDRMPAQKLIDQVIEAGTYAPTGMGMQSPIIVAVTNRSVRNHLSALNAAVMVGKRNSE